MQPSFSYQSMHRKKFFLILLSTQNTQKVRELDGSSTARPVYQAFRTAAAQENGGISPWVNFFLIQQLSRRMKTARKPQTFSSQLYRILASFPAVD